MAKPMKPRLHYVCPRCGQLVVRVFTAQQVGERWPVAVHKGVKNDQPTAGRIGSLTGSLGPKSASVNGFRDEGWNLSSWHR
jgi:hypothetical protein